MEQQYSEPQPPDITPHTRHYGWIGERMATFCETLAVNVRASLAGGNAAQDMSSPRRAARLGISAPTPSLETEAYAFFFEGDCQAMTDQ